MILLVDNVKENKSTEKERKIISEKIKWNKIIKGKRTLGKKYHE
jgi:hypothetical protein